MPLTLKRRGGLPTEAPAQGHRLEAEDFSVENTAVTEASGVAAADGIVVVLDLETTPELVAEGQVRDLNRAFQDLRKATGLHYTDRIEVALSCSHDLRARLEPHLSWMADQLLASEIQQGHLDRSDQSKEITLAGEPVYVRGADIRITIGPHDGGWLVI